MSAEHPDATWIQTTIRDLKAWLAAPSTEPTSQITGGGAIRRVEEQFSSLHDGRPGILVSSATYGMRAALLAAGVRPGSRVLIPGVDWGSTLAAVRSLGAVPEPVPVDPATETIHPESVARLVDGTVSALVACHLHGVPADVAALRRAVGSGLPIVEDCAQALGSTIDGRPVGTLGDLAVFSFGPNKPIDAGEAALVTCASEVLHGRLIELTAHPVRQILSGIAQPRLAEFSMRVAPTSAIRLAIALEHWQPFEARARHAGLRRAVEPHLGRAVLGADARRRNASPTVPIRCHPDLVRELPVSSVPSAAVNIRRLLDGHVEMTAVKLVERMRPGADAELVGVRRVG